MTNKRITDETTRTPIDGTELVRLATTGANWKAPLSTITTAFDPLSLTQGLSVITTDPTVGSNTSYRRAVEFDATYDKLTSDPGFTDQVTLGVQLNFNAGLNIFNSDPQANAQAKYTPIALNVGGNFIGAGEKFGMAVTSNFYSMGDSFMFSGNTVYAGGPIAGDEGQGWSPAMQLLQPNGAIRDTISSVTRTTYSATITSAVTGSQTAQNIAVSTTTGASVGDWIVINQSVPSNNSAIWATQILSINPGVSINCVCPINCAIATTITPALCLNLIGGGYQFGEGRVLVDNSGASYSTGTVAPSGGAFGGSGTTWTNTMVGGSALNIGAIYLDIDTFDQSPFSVGAPCRSVYQITTVASTTALGIFSTSTAADASYRGRGVGNTGLTYKILPAARVLLVNPVGSPSFSVICETSTHTWTAGDIVDCTICPYPDVHGWDYRLSQWTAGGNRRFGISLGNGGARTFDIALDVTAFGSLGNTAAPEYDGFGWNTGLQIFSAKNPIFIEGATSSDGTTYLGGPAIQIVGQYGTGADTAISWPGHTVSSLQQVVANGGMDFAMGDGALIRSVSRANNIDTHSPQVIVQGYLQLCGFGGFQPYLRIGGTTGPGDSIANTFDMEIASVIAGSDTLRFSTNISGEIPLFDVVVGIGGSFGGANVPPLATATAGVNQRSGVLQLTASVWNGSAAALKPCDIVVVPDSASATNTTVSMQFWVWDQVGNNFGQPNVPMAISSLGLLKFGKDSLLGGGDTRVTIDPSNLTAPRTVKFMDTAGDIMVAATNTTGAGSALLGSNSPATTNTAPYTWLKMISHDGSTVYVPAWK